MTSGTESPLYEHDCECCRFLGRYRPPEGRPVKDLYICSDSLIARFGSEPSQYESGIPFSYGMSPALTEARLRAEAAGLEEAFDLSVALSSMQDNCPDRHTLSIRARKHPAYKLASTSPRGSEGQLDADQMAAVTACAKELAQRHPYLVAGGISGLTAAVLRKIRAWQEFFHAECAWTNYFEISQAPNFIEAVAAARTSKTGQA